MVFATFGLSVLRKDTVGIYERRVWTGIGWDLVWRCGGAEFHTRQTLDVSVDDVGLRRPNAEDFAALYSGGSITDRYTSIDNQSSTCGCHGMVHQWQQISRAESS